MQWDQIELKWAEMTKRVRSDFAAAASVTARPGLAAAANGNESGLIDPTFAATVRDANEKVTPR